MQLFLIFAKFSLELFLFFFFPELFYEVRFD